MNRLDRRLRILRDKRSGCFDPDQRYLESAVRTKAARRVRAMMRLQRPVLLITPRWSRPDRFLDELSVDLQVGRPRVSARVVPLAVVKGFDVHEVWAFLLRSVVEACHLDLEGPASQPMHRAGFRDVLGTLLDRTTNAPRRALLLQGVEHLDVDTLKDLNQALAEHGERVGDERRFNLLFAGTASVPGGVLAGVEVVVLPDFSADEAVEALHEYLENAPARDVELAAALVGGVPALLHAVGVGAEDDHRFATTQDEVWRAIGPLADDLRSAIHIVASDGSLAERLEDVARKGALPLHPPTDAKLVRAGLMRGVAGARRPHVMVRAPLLAQLAGMVIGSGGEVSDGFDGPVV